MNATNYLQVILYYLVHYAKIPIDYAIELIKSKNNAVLEMV